MTGVKDCPSLSGLLPSRSNRKIPPAEAAELEVGEAAYPLLTGDSALRSSLTTALSPAPPPLPLAR
jgi:hypothetical protein